MDEIKRVAILFRKYAGIGTLVTMLTLGVSGTALAQTSTADPNPGAITFTGGLDVPSVYLFRGLVQETDPKLTLWPYGDIGIALASGEGALKSVAVNVGVWNSLNTGSSGSDGPTAHLHFEEDFYATLNMGFGGGVGVGLTYMALTYPNAFFDTVKEVQVKITKAHRLNPYGFLAFETTDVSADGGLNKGSYAEIGVGPTFPAGSRVSLTIPVKVGLSLKDFYEMGGKDHKFGWFDVGGLLTVPLTGIPARYGSWNVHAGVDLMYLGEVGKAFNDDKSSKVVALGGIGVTY